MLTKHYISFEVQISSRLRDFRHLKLLGLTETKKFALWRNFNLDLLIEVDRHLTSRLFSRLHFLVLRKRGSATLMHLAVTRKKVLFCNLLDNGLDERLARIFVRLVRKQTSAW